MSPCPDNPGEPSAPSPSASTPSFAVALSMGSPGGVSRDGALFSGATGDAATGALRSPPTAEQPAATAAPAGGAGGSRGSPGTSCQPGGSPAAADTPAVELEPLPSPAKPAGGGSGGAHPKGLPPLKRARPGRQDSAQPASADRSRSGAPASANTGQGASPEGAAAAPPAKKAKVAADALARRASTAASDAVTSGAPPGGRASSASASAPAKRPVGGPVLPPRPARAARAPVASNVPDWVAAAAAAPPVNAVLLKAAAKCPPRDCPAAWQLGLERDQRWSYVVHGAPGAVPGAEEDAPPLQGWAALHAAAATAPHALAACATAADAIRLGHEQCAAAAAAAAGGDAPAGVPRSVRRCGLNLSELAAMVSAAAAGHTSRSAEEESLADRTRRVLRAEPARRRGGRSAAGAGPLALARTLADKMAQGGGGSVGAARPQHNRPGPKPKPKPKPAPVRAPTRTSAPARAPPTKAAPLRPQARPKPRGRLSAAALKASKPPLPPPLPAKEGVWSAGETWPRAALFAAGRGQTRFLSLNAAVKNRDLDGEGDDMAAWARLHDALRKAGQLPEPLR